MRERNYFSLLKIFLGRNDSTSDAPTDKECFEADEEGAPLHTRMHTHNV